MAKRVLVLYSDYWEIVAVDGECVALSDHRVTSAELGAILSKFGTVKFSDSVYVQDNEQGAPRKAKANRLIKKHWKATDGHSRNKR